MQYSTKDNVEVAETLNTFFTGAGDTNGRFSNAVNQETTASNETTTGQSLLSLRKTDSIEVLEVMKKLRPNKATGHDLIPPKVIQQALFSIMSWTKQKFHNNGNSLKFHQHTKKNVS